MVRPMTNSVALRLIDYMVAHTYIYIHIHAFIYYACVYMYVHTHIESTHAQAACVLI